MVFFVVAVFSLFVVQCVRGLLFVRKKISFLSYEDNDDQSESCCSSKRHVNDTGIWPPDQEKDWLPVEQNERHVMNGASGDQLAIATAVQDMVPVVVGVVLASTK